MHGALSLPAPGHCPCNWASLTSTDTQAARGPRPVAQVSLAFPAAALSPGEENTVPARGRKPATRAARYGSPRAVQESQPEGRRRSKNAARAQRRAVSTGICTEHAPPVRAQRTPLTLVSTWALTCFSGCRSQGPALGLPHAEPEAHAGPGLHTHRQHAGRARHAGKQMVSRLRMDAVRLHQGKR